MKDPRPQDYDPSYKTSLKAEEFDVSELTPIAPKAAPVKPKNETPPPRPTVRPERPERVAPERPPSPTPAELAERREIKRHSFEFYRDQLPQLKRLKAEFMIRGADKSMSAMVREAVDSYIEIHTS